MLMKDDPTKQLVYYQVISLSSPVQSVLICFLQAGIGTYTSNVNMTGVMKAMTELRDKMFACTLSDHIKGPFFSYPTISPCLTNIPEGYKFLMQTCQLTALGSLPPSYCIQLDQSGDKICIFGFSRGAYTARALAGMLDKVGLLPQCNIEQLPFAYAIYEKNENPPKTGEESPKTSVQFKRTFSIDVRIEFLGVWYVTQAIGQLPTSSLCVGTPWDLLDGIRKTCHSVVRTVPLTISTMRYLLMNAVSSLPRPTLTENHPTAKASRAKRITRS